MKNILITGVSTGIGYGAAKEFINNGYRVLGSVRKQKDAERLQEEFGERFFPLIFDVTDHKAIQESVKIVEDKIGNEGLAGLINNAGETAGGPLMHVPLDLFRYNLDVLVTGQLAVTQAFLPLLGAKKNAPFPPGKILNISSISGEMASPFMGAYVAAKHALEGLSKTLRIELQLYGIDVIVIAPGMIKTPIWDKASGRDIEKIKDTDYYHPVKRFLNHFAKLLPTEGYELDAFCVRLREIFETKKPKTRYAVVRNRFKNYTIPKMLPDRMIVKFFAKMMGVTDKKA